jgi:hypothetical protein
MLVLAALAVALRALIWHRAAVLMNDGPVFLDLAQRFAAGEWRAALSHAFHPLYPLAIAATHAVLPVGWETAAVTVSALSGGAACAFLYDFLRRAFDPGVAGVGALLLVVHPYAAPFSADVQSEGLYMALFLGAVAWTWRTLEAPRLATGAVAGLLGGLAYLTRPEGLGVLLVGGALLGGLALRGRRSWRAAVAGGAGLGLVAALVAAPYVLFLEQAAGELRLTGKKSAVEIMTLKTRDRMALEGRRSSPTPAAAPPPPQEESLALGEALDDIWRSVRHSFRLDHLILAAFGAVAVGAPPALRGAYLLGIVGLYGFVLLGLHLTAGYVSMRHTLPPMLPLLGYVALGVPTLGRVLLALPWRLAGRGRPAAGVCFAVGLALLLTASTVMAARPQRDERAATRRAAEWLAERSPERVAASKERDAYYARTAYVPLPPNRPGWVDRLVEQGVRYVVVDERTFKRYPRAMGDATDPRLRVLHRVEANGREALVVEILETP